MSTKAKTALQRFAVTEVAIGALTPDPNQPRKAFDDKALQGLAASIGERGILQPILVRQDGNRIVIVDGERRWRAAKLAKLKVVSVLLADLDEDDAQQLLVDQVSVNQFHEHLRPMDLARVLRSMRDAGKTVNDIAAMLAKQGHEALKPAQITAMSDLVDLPEWVHAMVNAEEIEAGPAGKLLPLIAIKGVDKPLQKRLHQAAGYTGKVAASNVEHEAKRVLADLFADLGRTDSWSNNPVLFAWKTRCKGCEHLLTFEGSGYCRNVKLFLEHQKEAKDAGLLPGGKRPEKPKPVTGKAAEKAEAAKTEVREASLGEKARDYLHSYLARKLQGAVADSPRLERVLVIWAAIKKPGSSGGRGPLGVFYGGEPGASAAQSQGVVSLESLLLGDTDDETAAMAAAAQEIVCDLQWRETHAFARYYWPKLGDVWTPDAAFFDLFRKAELFHLAVKHECNPGEGRLWDRMKAGDVKAALLNESPRITRPAILVDLYEGEIDEPYNPRGWDEDEDDSQDEDALDDAPLPVEQLSG
jgi:ParB/RepB/Spo0J family partition protein